MVNAPEEGHSPEEEDEGGPVKSFLDHLEDLRWVLIKSAATVALAMLLCLIAGNYVVGIIKRPLEKAQIRYSGSEHVAVLMFGTNRLGTYHLDPAQQEGLGFGTNHFLAIQLQPMAEGTNLLLTLRNDPTLDAEK